MLHRPTRRVDVVFDPHRCPLHYVGGLVNACGLAIAGVAVVALVVGVAKLREPADEPAAENLSGTAPVVPEPSQPTLDAVGLPGDVVSRVDAAPVNFEPRGGGAPDVSRIGPSLDPEAAGYPPSDGRSRHIGEYLDPEP